MGPIPEDPAEEEKPKEKKKREEGDVGRILAWLCCDPLPPLPLGPKPTITIGRGDNCDLVLPHKEVSRYHALIKIRGSKLIQYEDEGSSNGSYLNGRRISSSSLKVNDKLVLGPYDLVIRSNEEMAARHGDETTKTKAFEITKARSNPNAIMSGSLKEVPLSELFQALEFNKRTGTLTVLTSDQKGVLVLQEGRPVGATLDDLRGEEAILLMLTLRQGRFSLSSTADEIEGEQNLPRSLTALLFEASRRVDEDSGEETAA